LEHETEVNDVFRASAAKARYIVCMNGKLDRITVNPAVMSGNPCIRGLRVTVANVLRLLAARNSREQILQSYPYLEPADIDACLEYAAMRVSEQEVDLAAT
jgi:uncharacterized protein (DUF433 family)